MLVAAIQFKPEFKNPRANLQKLAYLVRCASQDGAKLVVLPELCSTGYSFMSQEEAEPFAEHLFDEHRPFHGDKSLDVMRLLAKRWNIVIAWGLVEKDVLTGKLYNSQALVTPQGKITSYRKINRFSADYIWSSAGESNPPVARIMLDGREWKVGLLICRDVRDKRGDEKASFYEPGDADIVAMSANWGTGAFPANAWMDFVESNKCYLVVSNRYGKEIPNNFGEGGVCVISPDGTVQCKGLAWEEDCIVYGEVL